MKNIIKTHLFLIAFLSALTSTTVFANKYDANKIDETATTSAAADKTATTSAPADKTSTTSAPAEKTATTSAPVPADRTAKVTTTAEEPEFEQGPQGKKRDDGAFNFRSWKNIASFSGIAATISTVTIYFYHNYFQKGEDVEDDDI